MAPISSELAPSWLSRRGASTSSTPNPSPATVVSQRPVATPRSLTEANAAASPCGSVLAGAATRKFAAIRTVPNTAAAENVGPVPIWFAIDPTTGPNSAPPIAAPSAVPSSSPRRSVGAELAIHAIPAAQVLAPPIPCTNRAASSTTSVLDQANSSVEALIKIRPNSTPRRAPR